MFPHNRRAAGAVIASVLTALPIIRILSIICTTGADILSADLIYHVQALTRILSPSYNALNILRDSFYNGHLMFFPMLLRIMLAKLVYWNSFVELLCGFGTMILTCCLFYSALTARVANWRRIWLLPVLSLLIFSFNQINQFTFGDASVPMGLCVLGMAFMLWCLVRFGQTWKGVLLAATGAWFATWSWGQGIVAWPLILTAMALTNMAWQKRPSCKPRFSLMQFAVVLATAAISLAPIVVMLVGGSAGSAQRIVNVLNVEFVLAGIGASFVNGVNVLVNQQVAVGYVGLMCACSCIALVWTTRRTKGLRAIAPGCYVMAAAILSLWLLGIFRHGISIWYTGIGLLFWLGFMGMASAIVTTPDAAGALTFILRWLCGIGIIGVVIASILSGLTMDGKVYFLYARAPASASCVRYAESAPAHCEQRVILDGVEGSTPAYEFAALLKALRLSVFAPNQRWTLQGDYALDTVTVSDPTGIEPIQWLDDQTRQPLPWYDYHHLDLVLPTSNAISWTVYLPRTAQQVAFHSAVKSPKDSAQISLQAENATSQPLLWSQRLSSTLSDWQPIDIDLISYKGQTVTLILSSAPNDDISSYVLFRYPAIDVLLDTGPVLAQESQRVVSVNLTRGENDAIFARSAEQVNFTAPPNTCIGNYTHLLVRMRAASGVIPRVAWWSLQHEGSNGSGQETLMRIPLLGDGDVHDYTYALKLLNMKHNTPVAGLHLAMENSTAVPINQLHVEDVRLIGYHPGDYCK